MQSDLEKGLLKKLTMRELLMIVKLGDTFLTVAEEELLGRISALAKTGRGPDTIDEEVVILQPETPRRGRRKKRRLSAEARQRISDAQKKRWAKSRKGQ